MAYSLANNFAPSDSDEEAPPRKADLLGDGVREDGTVAKEGEGPSHEDKEETVLDFEKEDGSTVQERELHIFALPLYWNPDVPPEENLVFLPVSRFNEDGRIREGWQGKVKERIEDLQGAAAERWAKLKEKEEGTFGARVYKAGQRALNDMSIEERLTRNIPKNVSKVIIYHPSLVGPDRIMERLTTMTDLHGVTSAAKAAMASVMLPIAFGIDALIVPGPFFTTFTAYQIAKNTKNVVGNQRLTKMIAQDGKARDVRVCYAGDFRLDKYYEGVQCSVDGVMHEQDVEEMLAEIHEEGLLDALLELRKRRLREQPTRTHNGEKYGLLPSSGS
mmetsp:Transcript_20156/g.56135  ORF Transcript_20156/g.56135 Transcript_20156/m.56135 type:complete len:332 (+) Transcript_20156:114-1109(+)